METGVFRGNPFYNMISGDGFERFGLRSQEKEKLVAERATQQQLRDENAGLLQRLQARP